MKRPEPKDYNEWLDYGYDLDKYCDYLEQEHNKVIEAVERQGIDLGDILQ